MRILADSNAINSDAVVEFLKRSVKNRLCICDHVAMEILQPNGFDSLNKSLGQLRPFKHQIDVLFKLDKFASRCTRQRGLQKRVVDRTATQDFGNLFTMLDLAMSGDTSVQRQLSGLQEEAAEILENFRNDWADISKMYAGLQMIYTAHEIKLIRQTGPYSPALKDKIMQNTALLAKDIIELNADIIPNPLFPEVSTSFAFRLALVWQFHHIEWIGDGSPKSRSKRKANDPIDNTIITMATYFDDFQTFDVDAAERFYIAKHILQGLRSSELQFFS